MYVFTDPIRPIDADKVDPAEPGFELLAYFGEARVGRKPIIGWVCYTTDPVIADPGNWEIEDVPVIKHPNGCVIRSAQQCWPSEAEWLAAEQAYSEAR